MDTMDDPPAEGAGSTRAHRLRFAAIAAAVLVVGAVGTGIGFRLSDDDGDDAPANPAAGGSAAIVVPIAYPVGKKLPELGSIPGPLAAVWLASRAGGGPPEVVGLVAETGEFGTLPIAVSYNHDEALDTESPQLSPDGRLFAYKSLIGGLVVNDLVSGENLLTPVGVRDP